MADQTKPIEVAASPAALQAGTGLRDLLLIVAALPALVALLGKRDVVGWLTGWRVSRGWRSSAQLRQSSCRFGGSCSRGECIPSW